MTFLKSFFSLRTLVRASLLMQSRSRNLFQPSLGFTLALWIKLSRSWINFIMMVLPSQGAQPLLSSHCHPYLVADKSDDWLSTSGCTWWRRAVNCPSPPPSTRSWMPSARPPTGSALRACLASRMKEFPSWSGNPVHSQCIGEWVPLIWLFFTILFSALWCLLWSLRNHSLDLFPRGRMTVFQLSSGSTTSSPLHIATFSSRFCGVVGSNFGEPKVIRSHSLKLVSTLVEAESVNPSLMEVDVFSLLVSLTYSLPSLFNGEGPAPLPSCNIQDQHILRQEGQHKTVEHDCRYWKSSKKSGKTLNVFRLALLAHMTQLLASLPSFPEKPREDFRTPPARDCRPLLDLLQVWSYSIPD